MKTYKTPITKLEHNQIFVFGSNTEGRHGKGAAKWALDNAGAVYGQAKGLQGQSYAIVTKDLKKRVHPSIDSNQIMEQLLELWQYTHTHPEKEFIVAYSRNGVNLNGYTPQEMADTFKGFMWGENVAFEEEFLKLIMQL